MSLEMSDNRSEPTSRPQTLVRWLGTGANAMGVTIKGENALNCGNDSAYFWNNINHALDNYFFSGITILRMSDAVFGWSNRQFRKLVNRKIPLADPNSSRITFRLHNGHTVIGENVYVVGNKPELGNWDPSRAIKLLAYNYPSWTRTIEGIPQGSNLEFKFIKKHGGNVVWECAIPNRTLNVLENHIMIDANWNR